MKYPKYMYHYVSSKCSNCWNNWNRLFDTYVIDRHAIGFGGKGKEIVLEKAHFVHSVLLVLCWVYIFAHARSVIWHLQIALICSLPSNHLMYIWWSATDFYPDKRKSLTFNSTQNQEMIATFRKVFSSGLFNMMYKFSLLHWLLI